MIFYFLKPLIRGDVQRDRRLFNCKKKAATFDAALSNTWFCNWGYFGLVGVYMIELRSIRDFNFLRAVKIRLFTVPMGRSSRSAIS